jgi:tetratricopeptide (TPR) repeat protein
MMFNKSATNYLKAPQEQAHDHPDEAIAACNEAIRLNPLYAEAYIERARCFQRKGQLNEALADYTEALHINPNDVGTYILRGDLREMDMGDIDGGIADYTEAIRIAPQSWDAYMGRALVYYFDKGDYEAAIADYTVAISIHNTSAYTYHCRAWVYYLRDDFAHAIADYDKAIELDPQYIDSYLNRGRVKVEQSNFDAAISDFNKAQRVDPNSASPFYWRGYAYDEQNELEQAIIEYSDCINAMKTTQHGSVLHCDALNGRAWSLYRKGDYDQAIQDATDAIELYAFPRKNWLYYHTRGVSYAAKGEHSNAIEDFQQALAFEPEDPEYEQEMHSYIQQHGI